MLIMLAEWRTPKEAKVRVDVKIGERGPSGRIQHESMSMNDLDVVTVYSVSLSDCSIRL